MSKSVYYVTMTDKFMSGWGKADNKINKLIFICDSFEQANIVAENAKNRSDMKHINICTKKPSYSANRYLSQTKDIEEYPSWYQKGYFKKEGN